MLRPRGVVLHYEVELALVMGQEVRDLNEADEKGALDAVECILSLSLFASRFFFPPPPPHCFFRCGMGWKREEIFRDLNTR